MVFFLLKSMADELSGDTKAPELVGCLLDMTNELLQALERHELIHLKGTNIDGTGSVTEAPLFPPLPPLAALRQVSR
ncbi:hypothetical protein [Ruegeria sp. MALMAid1280]|uniref:hypothetical protein n=1 Tax=Ruegeria sp. MALMAid1280 TaxID=3411634 RepID=UPI003B9FF69C